MTQHEETADCVLLVDDDPAVRWSIKLMLRAHGYVVCDFASGHDLLSAQTGASCRCLVTDYSMPRFDGIELLRGLRAKGWSAPAILITGDLTRGLEMRAMKAGFSHVIEKPPMDDRLLTAVAQCFCTPCSCSAPPPCEP